jgi:hypothetical protein
VLSAGVNVHFDPKSMNKLGESFFLGETMKLVKFSVWSEALSWDVLKDTWESAAAHNKNYYS